ncbi:alpha/beta fold hydrolase [Neobacillus sp. NPDC097160]|uniref:alpha/beta fold hydrolase n=1 Tax=Neobacillus sp. NPDC097160 TaxID=3364298 RepID=UPI0038153DD0
MSLAQYDQGTIYYEETGNGEPLILIHGVGLDHQMWEKQVKGLSKKYQVICYDMLGHGGSDNPPGPYSLSLYVRQLAGLLQHLQIDTCHVVGFSMGGMVAQAFALEFPEKIKTLTILNAVANRTEEQRKAILLRVEEVKKSGAGSTIEPAIQRWFNPDFLKANESFVNHIRKRLQRNNPHSYLAAYTLFATADQELWPRLSTIKLPTLIITGEHDVGSTPEMSMSMHQQIDHSELLIFPKMKHMLPAEDADSLNQAIDRFIKRNAVPAVR